MDKKGTESYKPIPMQIFQEEMIPVPPGTRKSARHLLPGEDPWAMNRRWWLVTAGIAVAMLVIGILAGRFLIP
jgi:hypothetical protein